MAYSNFTLDRITEELSIEISEKQLFGDKAPSASVSSWLAETLKEFAHLALSIDTEKAKSEFIIAPVLLELKRNFKTDIGLFSGISFSVDKESGLDGICDFIISAAPQQFYLTVPVFAVVEAKKDDVIAGLGQCIATMHAASLFNKKANKDLAFIYGTVTNGELWRFIKLENQTAFIDNQNYFLKDIEILMGILNHIAKTTLKLI